MIGYTAALAHLEEVNCFQDCQSHYSRSHCVCILVYDTVHIISKVVQKHLLILYENANVAENISVISYSIYTVFGHL